MDQCVIFNSDQPGAKLIGIEYLISDRLYHTLPAEEKCMWRSHVYEEEVCSRIAASGMLVAPDLPVAAETSLVMNIAGMYGKIIHTWQANRDALPLGAPSLMMSLTADGQLRESERAYLEAATGISMEERRAHRQPLKDWSAAHKARAEGVDAWEKTGQGVQFRPTLVPISLQPGVAAVQAAESRLQKDAAMH